MLAPCRLTSQNLDVVVESVKNKEKILRFLDAQDFLKELEKSCIYYQSEYTSEKCFSPLFVNFHLRFGDIESGEIFIFF